MQAKVAVTTVFFFWAKELGLPGEGERRGRWRGGRVRLVSSSIASFTFRVVAVSSSSGQARVGSAEGDASTQGRRRKAKDGCVIRSPTEGD